MDFKVLRQDQEASADELLGRLALCDGGVGALQVVEDLLGVHKFWAHVVFHVALENVILEKVDEF